MENKKPRTTSAKKPVTKKETVVETPVVEEPIVQAPVVETTKKTKPAQSQRAAQASGEWIIFSGIWVQKLVSRFWSPDSSFWKQLSN